MTTTSDTPTPKRRPRKPSTRSPEARRSHHAPAANPSQERQPDSGKPAVSDQTPAVADARSPRKPQPDGKGQVKPVVVSDSPLLDDPPGDHSEPVKAPARSSRVRSDKRTKTPVHNPDPSVPQPPAGLGDGRELPQDHSFVEDGPTFAPATDSRLAISPHGDNPDNSTPVGVVGNATEEARYAPGAYLPLDPARATDAVRIDGSYAVPNPPQYVATEGLGPLAPSVRFEAPSSAVAQSAVDAEYARITEGKFDSPHGEAADIVGHPHGSGAPADSHGPAQTGDNPAADARARSLADLRAAEAARYPVE